MRRNLDEGPVQGHWTKILRLVRSCDNGGGFVCLLCTADGNRQDKATFPSSFNASYLYSHLKHVHPAVYSVLSPILENRMKNKRPRPQLTTITELMTRTRNRSIEDALLCLYAFPDVPERLFENPRFKRLIQSCNNRIRIPSRKTMNVSLWKRFQRTLEHIRGTISLSEFFVITFDGWSSRRNESVLGFMVSKLDEQLNLKSKTVGNFKVTRGHTADDVASIIRMEVRERCGNKIPDYFVSDSAAVNPCAARKFLGEARDDRWFPCSVQILQLAMRKAVGQYLNRSDNDSCDVQHDYESCDSWTQESSPNTTRNTLYRILTTCRAIRLAIKRSHHRTVLFDEYQCALGIKRAISLDATTRFDSTLDMLESALLNKPVLLRLQERGRRDASTWSLSLHFFGDDFELMRAIITILKPVREATRQPSLSSSWVGEVVPVFTSTIVALESVDVPSSSVNLKENLVSELAARLGMLLNTDLYLITPHDRKCFRDEPNEFIISALLNPRYLRAMEASFGFDENSVTKEISRLFDFHFEAGSGDGDSTETQYSTIEESNCSFVDKWAEKLIQEEPNRSRWRRNCFSIRNEYMSFRADVFRQNFGTLNARGYWCDNRNRAAYPRFSRLARLFLTVPASSIPQERHFSEVKRRCAGLRIPA